MTDDTLHSGFPQGPEATPYAESVARRQAGARRQVRGQAYTGPSQPLDEPNAHGFHPIQNVWQVERWGSVVGGAALLWAGLRTGRLNGLLLGGLGASLLYRGVSGHCMAYEALGIDSAEHPEATAVGTVNTTFA